MAKLKNNGLIRGLYFSARRLKDYFVRSGAFAQVADSVIITPPPYMWVTIRMSSLVKESA